MTFAYDNYIQFPTRDLYDSSIMKMAIDAAKDMYDKGEAQLKEFYKDYGDFTSPFAKDMARYGEMVGGVRDMINDAYAHGVDLLRTPQGRAMISQAINKINPAELNMMRSNAKTGYAYLDALQKLRSEGKYSEAQELFDIAFNKGTQFNDFATATPGKVGFNTWDRVSPIKSVSLQEMVHPSFAHIKPHLLSSEEAKTRVGKEYDPRAEYTGVTRADMEGAMRSALPGLVGTPMYEYYKNVARQELINEGKDPTEAEVNERFVQNAITADSQMMTPLSKDYSRYFQEEGLKYKRASLALQQQSLALRRQMQAAKARGDQGGPGTQLTGRSLASTLYHAGMAKAWSADGITKDIINMPGSYEEFGKQAPKIFSDFGKKFKSEYDTSLEALLKTETGKKYSKMVTAAYNKPYNELRSDQRLLLDTAKREAKQFVSKQSILDTQEAYRKQFSIPMDPEAVTMKIGTPLSDNKRVAKVTDGIIDKIYGADDIISNTAGYTKTHTSRSTNEIRNAIRKYGAANTTVSSMEEGYASLRKNGGNFSVVPRVKVVCTDKDGNVKFQRYAYVDIGLSSYTTSGGAYLGDYREEGGQAGRFVEQRGEPYSIGNKTFKGDLENVRFIPDDINAYPNINNWPEFGVWDTDATAKRLHVPYSNLGTFLPDGMGGYDPYEDYNPLLMEE